MIKTLLVLMAAVILAWQIFNWYQAPHYRREPEQEFSSVVKAKKRVILVDEQVGVFTPIVPHSYSHPQTKSKSKGNFEHL